MNQNVTKETIQATNKARTEYFKNLQVKPLDFQNTEIIDPCEIKIGDHMIKHGFIYEVTEIKTFTKDWRGEKKENPTYVVIGLYVSGDIKTYKWMAYDNQNGCAPSHYSSCQGNGFAMWTRVIR
tara:strand:- start:265 stop:636 length:372 start_codon:yes stop_codon:yes gene_type:complete